MRYLKSGVAVMNRFCVCSFNANVKQLIPHKCVCVCVFSFYQRSSYVTCVVFV